MLQKPFIVFAGRAVDNMPAALIFHHAVNFAPWMPRHNFMPTLPRALDICHEDWHRI